MGALACRHCINAFTPSPLPLHHQWHAHGHGSCCHAVSESVSSVQTPVAVCSSGSVHVVLALGAAPPPMLRAAQPVPSPRWRLQRRRRLPSTRPRLLQVAVSVQSLGCWLNCAPLAHCVLSMAAEHPGKPSRHAHQLRLLGLRACLVPLCALMPRWIVVSPVQSWVWGRVCDDRCLG